MSDKEADKGEFEKRRKENYRLLELNFEHTNWDTVKEGIEEIEYEARADERERVIGIIDKVECDCTHEDNDFNQGYDFACDEIRKKLKVEK